MDSSLHYSPVYDLEGIDRHYWIAESDRRRYIGIDGPGFSSW